MGRGTHAPQQTHPVTPTLDPAAADGDPPPTSQRVAGRVGPPGGASGGFRSDDRTATTEETDAAIDALADLRRRRQHAARRVQDELSTDRAAAERLQQHRRQEWPDEPEVSYGDDPAAFQREYDAARQRRSDGEEPVPYMLENATDGLGDRNGGRAFGLEIEYDLPYNADPHAVRQAIARDLHAEGLARDGRAYGYHASRRAGYTDAANAWRVESDTTVAGEVVSPIMYDEPRTWQNLQKVCEIIRRHGGRASIRTGGHIHVALPDYDHTVENHNRLLNLAGAHQDLMYRLGQNPAADAHRGTSWCQPNTSPGHGYSSVTSMRQSNQGHTRGLNFESVHGDTRRDHVEFRMWDGSLNPAVIQTQIKVSLGLTDAASRGAGAGLPAEPLGTHRRRNEHLQRGQRLRGEAWQADTRSFRGMVDTIFSRSRDKAQATALFAVTRWQRNR